MKKSAIVIIHFGQIEDTLDCLNSLQLKKKDNRQVFLINNSLDIKLEQKIKAFPNISLITPKVNLGFAKGNNLGINYALREGCPYILLLNNDTLSTPDLVDQLVSFAATSDKIALVSPKIYFAKGYEFHKDRYTAKDKGQVIWYAGGIFDWDNVYAKHRGVDEVDRGQYDQVAETDFATGCCLLMKKEVIDKISLFNEKYFLYFEDVDYSLRAKRKGYKVFYYPKAYLWHKNAASSHGAGSVLHQYYQTRNRLYLGLTYAPLRTKKALIFQSLKDLLNDGIKRKAILDFYLGRMGKSHL